MKSGVDFEGMHGSPVSEKETALAMLESIKTNSGLFKDEQNTAFVAPHFCDYRPVRLGLLPSFTKLDRPITAFRTTDNRGVTFRHFMGFCSKCRRAKIVAQKIN